MKSSRTRNLIIGGVAVVLIAAGGGAYAIADSSKEKDQEKTLTAAETARAEKAATAEVNGKVLYVEHEEDYGGGYEVEMQLENGSEAEVYLDKSFKVAGVDRYHGEKGDRGEPGERGDHDEHGERGDRGEHGEKGYEDESKSEYGAAGKTVEPAMQGNNAGR